MTYPNARKGISKLLIAEILTLVGAALAAIITIMGAGAYGAVAAGDAGTGAGLAIGSTGLALATFIIAIIGGILALVGLWQAGKDEPRYIKVAFWLSILNLVLAFISGIVSTGDPTMKGIFDLSQRTISLLVFCLTIFGIGELAKTIGNEQLARTGNRIMIFIVVVMIISILLQIIPMPVALAGIMGIVALLLLLVTYITYIVLLVKAKGFFAAN